MKQNIIYSVLFFIVLFILKYFFDKSDTQSMLINNKIGTLIFLYL